MPSFVASTSPDLMKKLPPKAPINAAASATSIESAIMGATASFAERDEIRSSHKPEYPQTLSLDGLAAQNDPWKFSERTLNAIASAWPLPTTVAGLVSEYALWTAAAEEREWETGGKVSLDITLIIRMWLLEVAINSSESRTAADLEARHMWTRMATGLRPPSESKLVMLDKLQAKEEQASPKPKTPNERRALACRLIIQNPDLNDEEIATLSHMKVAIAARHRRRLERYCKEYTPSRPIPQHAVRRDVIDMLRREPHRTNKQIAQMTGATLKTVKTHRTGIRAYSPFARFIRSAHVD